MPGYAELRNLSGDDLIQYYVDAMDGDGAPNGWTRAQLDWELTRRARTPNPDFNINDPRLTGATRDHVVRTVLRSRTNYRNQQPVRRAPNPPNPDPVTGTPDPTAVEPPGSRPNASGYLQGLLDSYGLGGLSDWLMEQIRLGVEEDEIIQGLRQQPLYKERFKAIEQRRLLGLPALSETEVIDYENTARGMFRSSGLPEGFYDQFDDFTAFLVNDVSIAELSSRVEDGYVRVANADPSIRAAWTEWFGSQQAGDAALAAIFLDHERALPLLQRQVAAAEIGGIARNFNFGDINQEQAFDLTGKLDPGVTRAEINRGMTRLAEVRPVFQETVSRRENGDDLQAGREGLAYAFETGDAERVRNRIRQRLADFSGGTKAAMSQRGMIGTGTAR